MITKDKFNEIFCMADDFCKINDELHYSTFYHLR